MTNLTPQQIWKGFHWSFFVNIQGLIICFNRFEMFLTADNLTNAQIELETAADLMLASSSAMELAGSFSRQQYENLVRQTMCPPFVKSNNFSGLMSWEHASLVKLWQRLHPVFQTLPAALKPEHEKFTAAYVSLATAHKAVCQKFGGGDTGSLRSDKCTAVDTLDKFAQNRWQLIASNYRNTSGCPFHNNISQK
jgi:hypothetical protein